MLAFSDRLCSFLIMHVHFSGHAQAPWLWYMDLCCGAVLRSMGAAWKEKSIWIPTASVKGLGPSEPHGVTEGFLA